MNLKAFTFIVYLEMFSLFVYKLNSDDYFANLRKFNGVVDEV